MHRGRTFSYEMVGYPVAGSPEHTEDAGRALEDGEVLGPLPTSQPEGTRVAKVGAPDLATEQALILANDKTPRHRRPELTRPGMWGVHRCGRGVR